MTTVACIACGSTRTQTLVDLPNIPVVCNDLHDSAASAQAAATGTMRIEYCSACHHFFNSAFDDSVISYSENYETSLHHSAVFQEYAAGLVDKLVNGYAVTRSTLLEVGCGRGEFLNSLCNAGANTAFGFDTSYDGGATIGEQHPGLNIRSTYFDAELELPAIDLVVSQQVLEHVEDPRAFLDLLVSHPSVAGHDALLYLEVPNGLYTFANDGIWDLIYEHVSYFSSDSLLRLVESCGCEVIEHGESFGGQYLYLVARVSGTDHSAYEAQRSYAFVDGFADRFAAKTERWERELSSDLAATGRTFVWGAGSKGITFCNIMDPEGKLGGLVDRHPNKVGKFVPSTGAPILSPSMLPAAQPDRIIVMNPLYIEEIRVDLASAGLQPEILEA
ncbi:MAG: class I SAM-dependent methyltransferase [Acidimicrobiales bacterium]